MKLTKFFIIGIILFIFINMAVISANEKVTDDISEIDTQETVNLDNDDSSLKTDDESYLKTDDSTTEAEIIPVNLVAGYGKGNFSFKLVDKNTNQALEGKKLSYTIYSRINSAGSIITDANGIATLDNSKLKIYSDTDNNTNNYNLIPTPITIGKQLFSIKCVDEGISAAEFTGNLTIKPNVNLEIITPDTFYYNSGNLATVKITDYNGKAVSNAILLVEIYTGNKSNDYLYQSDDNGIVVINENVAVGSHELVVMMAETSYGDISASKNFTVKKANAKITANKVTAYYKSGKYLTVKITNSNNNLPVYNANVNVKMTGSGNKIYTASGQTLLDGTLKISLDNLATGTYNVVISNENNKNIYAKQITTKIVIKKINAKATAPKLTAKYKKSKTFKITVKANNKPLKKVKLKLKVGSKSYTRTTNSKGVASFNTKKLSVGKYAVSVTSKDSRYSFSAKSSIVIKK